MYDSNGFWLAMKRFSKGKLAWWPTDKQPVLQVQAAPYRYYSAKGPTVYAYSIPWRKHSEDASQI